MRSTLDAHVGNLKTFLGSAVAYVVFASWALITILPLFWMAYSSFKSNEEITRHVYRLPHDLFANKNDEYVVIAPQLNVVPDYDAEKDTRPRLIIESTTIAPTRRLLIHFLVKDELPAEIAAMKPGDRLTVSQLPAKAQSYVHWRTVWYNYRSAFTRGGLAAKFVNSVIYAGVSTFFIVLFGLMIGFALSKMAYKKASAIIAAMIGLGYLISINSLIVPLFLMLRSVKLTDTHLGMILVYTAFGLPMSVMLSTQFIRGLPDSLIESAFIDGATVFRMFISIIVPMTVPVITTVSIVNALGIWNEFLLVLVLASSEFTKSLPVGVFSFSSLQSTEQGWQVAALCMAVAPAMLVYFLFNKRLTQGVVAGAVKG